MPAAPWDMLGVPTQPTATERADMFDAFMKWANGGFTQTISAAVFFFICRWIALRWRSVGDEQKSAMSRRSLRVAGVLLGALQYLVVLGYVGWQLKLVMSKETPITRPEVVEISFWTGFLLLVFVRMLTGPSESTKPTQSAKHQPCRCSGEAEGQRLTGSSHSSNQQTAPDMRKQQPARES